MKALIAMSGGVDSSVAAYLMQQDGFECIGCTMHLYDNEDAGVSRSRTCCSLDDVNDARDVAYSLGMDFFVFNFSRDFRHQIIDKFISCYQEGITPNPCIDCNKYMKFDKLFQRAEILGCDYVVTGHYARIIELHTGKKCEPGCFLDMQGKCIGMHHGIINYTIGQRRGLGISAQEPLYVVSINSKDNTVTVGHDNDLYSSVVRVKEFNWISGVIPEGRVQCKAKIRYRSKEQPAVALPQENGMVKIVFEKSQRAVTPGQAAVLYDGDIVLGGGTIVQ